MTLRNSRILAVLLLVLVPMSASAFAEKGVAASASEICPILPGAPVPDVNFKTLDNTSLSLQEAVSEKPTLLIFYRGGW